MRQKRRDVFFSAAKLLIHHDVRGEELLPLDNLSTRCLQAPKKPRDPPEADGLFGSTF